MEHLQDIRRYIQQFILACFWSFPSLATAAPYMPPTGIPAPGFGIDQSHLMYRGKHFDAGGFDYRDAGNGPYTHYIDNTDSTCTDSGNTYGTPSRPRCTLPTQPQAGAVIEIHGGPYAQALKLIGVHGSNTQPIFYRGHDPRQKVILQGTDQTASDATIVIEHSDYLILENLHLDGSPFAQTDLPMGIYIRQGSTHIAIRDSEVSDYPMTPFDPARGTASSFKTTIGLGGNSHWQAGDVIQDIVFYNNELHHNGDYPATYESGRHAISIGGGISRLWLLENHIHHNAEDGFQIFWYSDGSRGDPSHHIYVGGNEIHHNGENAVDVKQSHDVIISENLLYDHHETHFAYSGSDGAAVVFNDDSPNTRLWLINNIIHDSGLGVRNQSSGENFIIGNIFYHLRGENDRVGTSVGDGIGAAVWATSAASLSILNNTVVDTTGGFYVPNGTDLIIRDNIISNMFGDQTWHIALYPNNFSRIQIEENLLWQPDRAVLLKGVDDCNPCVESDPVFFNVISHNYNLQHNSPAIGWGSADAAFQRFQDLYGLDIRQDMSGNTRDPGSWDLGSLVLRQSFQDVPVSHWAWMQTENLAISGITTGCDMEHFCPEAPVSRAQMAVFLERSLQGRDWLPPPPQGNLFDDVSLSYWAAAWIEQLARDGITAGCGDGNYCPEAPVSRAQMAKFLLKTRHGANYEAPTGSGTTFSDVPASHWAVNWVEQLSLEGITSGCGGGKFCPEDSVNRSQMAVFLSRSLGL